MRGIEEVSSCVLELGYFFLASKKATHIVPVRFGNAFEWRWIGPRRRSGTRLEKQAASYLTERSSHLGHFSSSFSVNTKDLRFSRFVNIRPIVCKILYCTVTLLIN